MKLFNKRYGIASNTIVGITLRAFLLLFATKNTYAISNYLDSGADPWVLSQYDYIRVTDIRSLLPLTDGATISLPTTLFFKYSQVSDPVFVARKMMDEAPTFFDSGLMLAGGVAYFAKYSAYRTLEITKTLDTYAVKAIH